MVILSFRQLHQFNGPSRPNSLARKGPSYDTGQRRLAGSLSPQTPKSTEVSPAAKHNEYRDQSQPQKHAVFVSAIRAISITSRDKNRPPHNTSTIANRDRSKPLRPGALNRPQRQANRASELDHPGQVRPCIAGMGRPRPRK